MSYFADEHDGRASDREPNRVLDDICRRFTSDWESEGEPHIDGYLRQWESQRDTRAPMALLYKLVEIDLEQRWRRALRTVSAPGGLPAATVARFNGAPATGRTLPDGPKLEDYVAHYPQLGPLESLPLDLIVCEYRVRLQAGDAPQREEYLQRFRAHRQAINEWMDNELVDTASQQTTRQTAADVETASRHQGRMVRVRCPSCHDQRSVSIESVDQEIHCPSCGAQFKLASSDGLESTPSQPAERSIGHFQLLEQLGAGAFGTVWKARDTQLDRVVAVKIPRSLWQTGDETEQFLREARAAAQLRHPNIVSIHEVGVDANTVFIVSDYIAGQSLEAWRVAEQPTQREAAAMCEKLARALHYAHEQGVVHRDLKPANIMVDAQGEPQVMDFGLAKRETGEITMTLEGQILGTPAYMSPEQAVGEGYRADCRSDVYSLGVILYELLTGERPFRGDIRALLRQVAETDPPAPRQLKPAVDRDVETICLKCLEKVPHRRYPIARALGDDLQRYLQHEPITARPPGRWYRLGKYIRRNRVLVGGAVTTSLALSLGMAGTTVGMFRANEQTKLADIASQNAMDEAKRAKTAEHKLSREVAASYGRMAELATQRGNYREALDYVDRALAAGSADEVAVRLDRVDLLSALSENRQALDELQRAEAMDTDSAHAGKICMLQAELMPVTGDESLPLSRQKLNEALQYELDPADRAYVQARLADSIPTAIEYLEESLRHDPFHLYATSFQVSCLMAHGDYETVERRMDAYALLHPDDPYPVLYGCLTNIVKGNFDEARAQIEAGSGQLNPEIAELLRLGISLVEDTYERWMKDQGSFSALSLAADTPRTILKMQAILAQVRRIEAQPELSSVSFLTSVRSNRVLFKEAVSPMFSVYMNVLFGRNEAIVKTADKAIQVNPVGDFLYHKAAAHYFLYLDKKDDNEKLAQLLQAEEAARKAMNANWFIPVLKNQATPIAIESQFRLGQPQFKWYQPGQGTASEALRNLRRALAQDDQRAMVPALPVYCLERFTYQTARLGEHELARTLAKRWHQARPNEVNAMLRLAEVELALGSFISVLDACDQALALAPENVAGRRVQKAARAFANAKLAGSFPNLAADAAFDSEDVLTWALCTGCFASVTTSDNKTHEVSSVQQLPQGEYKIKSLFLRGNQSITDADLPLLFHCGDLTGCALGRTQVTNAGIECLKKLDSLRWLELVATEIDDGCIEHLSEMRNLRELIIRETKITDDGVRRLQTALPDCRIHRYGTAADTSFPQMY